MNRFSIDPQHSQLHISMRHFGVALLTVRMTGITGTLTHDGTQASIQAEIDAATVSAGLQRLDGFLVGEKLFDVTKHPKVALVAEGLLSGRPASGELTLLGVQRPVQIAALTLAEGRNPTAQKSFWALQATIEAKRSAHGMDMSLKSLSDDITLVLNIEAG